LPKAALEGEREGLVKIVADEKYKEINIFEKRNFKNN